MKTKIAITLGAMALSAVSGAAYAGSITQPGETVGIALGAPLPEGVYFVDTSSYGSARSLGDDGWAGVTIPVVAWLTPWQILGGRIEAYVAAPLEEAGITQLPPVIVGNRIVPQSVYVNGFYNPALLVGEAWGLGNGWNFSTWVGGYAPVDDNLGAGHDAWVFNSRSAITYNADNWDLTAHLIYGALGNVQSGALQGFKASPDYVNLDLTATKTLGKWEVGLVAFGSWDVSGISAAANGGLPYKEQGQFAVGGLVGYDFAGISVQSFLTTDVWTEGYYNPTSQCIAQTGFNCNKAYETRFWTCLVIPLWSPPAVEQVTYKN